MTLTHDSKTILRENPSAICINFTETPSLKNILPAIKSSSNLHILEESEDYVIIDSLSSEIKGGIKIKAINRSPSNHSNFNLRIKLFKKRESVFSIFLKNTGIDAKLIASSPTHKDNEPIVNASGIIF